MYDSQGNKHYIYHSRPGQLPKGYRATISLRKINDWDHRLGVSVCSPDDQFVKKVGVIKAIGRSRASYGPKIWINKDRNSVVKAIFNTISRQIEKGQIDPIDGFKNEIKKELVEEA